jgi:hypothetical protein
MAIYGRFSDPGGFWIVPHQFSGRQVIFRIILVTYAFPECSFSSPCIV